MNEAPKPTDGPWVQFIDMGKCVAIMPAGRPGDICTFDQAPSDADAALMTAAPDLLAFAEEVKRRCIEMGMPGHELCTLAEAAITKAQGPRS